MLSILGPERDAEPGLNSRSRWPAMLPLTSNVPPSIRRTNAVEDGPV
jgi:hypothetical protein